MNKSFLALTAASMLLASQGSHAADITPVYEDDQIDILYEETDEFVTPVGHYNWSGLRVGLIGQYNSHESKGSSGETEVFSIEPSGGIFGASLSYDAQDKNLIYGLKGDVLFGSIEEEFKGDDITYTEKNKLQAHMMLRFGVAMDKLLFYGLGGMSYTNNELEITTTADDDTTSTASQEGDKLTWSLGAGTSVAINEKMSASLEYIYKPYEYEVEVNDTEYEIDNTSHAFRIGVDYRFQ